MITEFNHAQARRSLKHRYAEVENEVKDLAMSAYQNETVTRGRVVSIEALLSRSFWGRFNWLLTGK